WIEWGKAIFIEILVAFILRSFIFAASIVEGESMMQALEDGERIIFNKFVYIIGELECGEIIIIKSSENNYVKRVIDLVNERIEMRNHELYTNDEKQSSYVDEYLTKLTRNFGPVTIPEDSYFVMGDNRPISKDSRNGLGFIDRSDIVGRSEFVIFPFRDWEFTR